MKDFDEMLRTLNSLKQQEEINLFTKKWMANLLMLEDIEEDDLEVTELELEEFDALNEAEHPYMMIEELSISYVLLDEFKCFKLLVEEVMYTYFVSPRKVLMLDNENILDD